MWNLWISHVENTSKTWRPTFTPKHLVADEELGFIDRCEILLHSFMPWWAGKLIKWLSINPLTVSNVVSQSGCQRFGNNQWRNGRLVEAVSTSSLLDLLLLLLLLLLPPPSPPTTNELAEKSLISVQQPQEGINENNKCGSEPDQELSLALDGKSWQGPTRGCHASQIQSHHLPPFKCLLLRCCLTLPTSCHLENPVAKEN